MELEQHNGGDRLSVVAGHRIESIAHVLRSNACIVIVTHLARFHSTLPRSSLSHCILLLAWCVYSHGQRMLGIRSVRSVQSVRRGQCHLLLEHTSDWLVRPSTSLIVSVYPHSHVVDDCPSHWFVQLVMVFHTTPTLLAAPLLAAACRQVDRRPLATAVYWVIGQPADRQAMSGRCLLDHKPPPTLTAPAPVAFPCVLCMTGFHD